MQETGQLLTMAAFVLVALVSCLVALASVRKCRREARKAQQALDELVLVEDTLDMLRTAVKRTEGRIVKNQVRKSARSGDDDEPPDPKLDPEGWKQWQNRRITQGKSLQ